MDWNDSSGRRAHQKQVETERGSMLKKNCSMPAINLFENYFRSNMHGNYLSILNGKTLIYRSFFVVRVWNVRPTEFEYLVFCWAKECPHANCAHVAVADDDKVPYAMINLHVMRSPNRWRSHAVLSHIVRAYGGKPNEWMNTTSTFLPLVFYVSISICYMAIELWHRMAFRLWTHRRQWRRIYLSESQSLFMNSLYTFLWQEFER